MERRHTPTPTHPPHPHPHPPLYGKILFERAHIHTHDTNQAPDEALLERRPYKRNASLISRPMWRNILVQSAYQIIVLLLLLLRCVSDSVKWLLCAGTHVRTPEHIEGNLE